MNKIKIEVDGIEPIDENYEVIDDGDWDDHGKYQYKTMIVWNKETNKFYQYSIQRSGSYFSDYYYDTDDEPFVDAVEVEERERTIVETYWKVVD